MSRHPMRNSGSAAVLALALLLGACASRSDRVVLLPQADGRPSAVQVAADGQAVLLNQPYATAERRGSALATGQTTAEEVSKTYGALLAQQPARPRQFTVQFESNGSQLSPAAGPVLDEVRRVLAGLPAAEVIVTGHTDRVGSLEANDRLSLQRAEAVREILVASGLPREAITVAGRGEREPQVPTADEVAEPRNRRVEIKLR